MPLSENQIKTTLPGDKISRLSDGRGLYLEVHPGGAKYWKLKYYNKFKRANTKGLGKYPDLSLKEASWRLKYYTRGKASIKTFGHWPMINIASARNLALEFRTKSQNNNGVNLQRTPQTFKELADEWGEKFLIPLSQKEIKTKKVF
ncbi:MAG: Arm DNA-binding domain-containing protein [Deltaproteobacteria bacterium]|nr:Arm DNA-binding domain-containing protein [Deltaproteobacteria bacterium]